MSKNTTTTTPTGFQPWSAVADLNLRFALVASGAVAYDPEKEMAVYFHVKMTGHEPRPRFVVCSLDSDRPLFSFLGTEREAPELANKKYRAWLKKHPEPTQVQH